MNIRRRLTNPIVIAAIVEFFVIAAIVVLVLKRT